MLADLSAQLAKLQAGAAEAQRKAELLQASSSSRCPDPCMDVTTTLMHVFG